MIPYENIALLLLGLPLVAGLSAFVKGKTGLYLHTGILAVGLLLSLILLIQLPEPLERRYEWFLVGESQFTLGLLLTRPAVFMTFVVSLITCLVSLYSHVYMAEDPGIKRYFFALGLFATSMLGIVMADNLLIVFVFWELVGFSSYLLINHYYYRDKASKAASKAFIVNRIGDAGFVIGLTILWAGSGTLDITAIDLAAISPVWITTAGLCLFLGVIGKSAQFPLQVWLPDAMEGPTPASALIHAATMVAAGVYLLTRIYALLNPVALDVIAITGAVTAFMGAVAAMTQFDIKRVLAFSTISQLGYMVMAVGTMNPAFGLMHLFTHAFFKAGLFLGAGSVIHMLHQQSHESGEEYDAQDMRNMGGLRNRMPWTFVTYLVYTAALVGLPLTSGFLTKDAVLAGSVAWLGGTPDWHLIIPVLAFVTVALTAFYMTRQIIMVFFGNERTPQASQVNVQESPLGMIIPLVILAIGSLWIIWSRNPFSLEDGWAFMSIQPGEFIHQQESLHLYVSLGATALLICGGLLAYFKFRNRTEFHTPSGFFARLSFHNWWLNEIYQKIVVQPVMALAAFMQALDVRVIDRIIDSTGIFYVLFSHIVGWFDKRVVDGTVHLLAGTARLTGNISAGLARGGAQYYLWIAVFLALLFMWILI
jgi:NADH-quinone oxidoreductase subunit L